MGALPSPRLGPRAASTRLLQKLWLCCLVGALPLGCQRPQWKADQEGEPNQGSVHPVTPSLPAAPSGQPREPGKAGSADPASIGIPSGFERADVVGIAPTERGHAIVLQAGQRALPIFVGESEGLSIQLRLNGERFHRPLTHDLMDAVLEELGGSIESVRVDRFEEEIFYSVVVLEHQRERRELDSRTSDAIALALGHKVPIFVRTSVLESSSVDLESLLPGPNEKDAVPRGAAASPPGSTPLEPGTVAL